MSGTWSITSVTNISCSNSGTLQPRYTHLALCPLVSVLIVTERLSTRLLIMQCGQLVFVCIYIYIYIYMYMYMYIYIRHTLIKWVQFPWSRPQTTRHMVLIWPGSRRWSTCEKIVREPKLNGPGAMWYWSDQEAIDVWKTLCKSQNEAGAVQAWSC